MPFHVKDDFKPTDKVFSVPASWFNAVGRFLNTLCVTDGSGAYFTKPVVPSDNEPVALVFPQAAAAVTPGTAAELGADQDQSDTARATDWDAGDVDGSGNPAGVKVWHHRYFVDVYDIYQVSWYELHNHEGKLIKVSAETTPLKIFEL
jgi:hypothetical protein